MHIMSSSFSSHSSIQAKQQCASCPAAFQAILQFRHSSSAHHVQQLFKPFFNPGKAAVHIMPSSFSSHSSIQAKQQCTSCPAAFQAILQSRHSSSAHHVQQLFKPFFNPGKAAVHIMPSSFSSHSSIQAKQQCTSCPAAFQAILQSRQSSSAHHVQQLFKPFFNPGKAAVHIMSSSFSSHSSINSAYQSLSSCATMVPRKNTPPRLPNMAPSNSTTTLQVRTPITLAT